VPPFQAAVAWRLYHQTEKALEGRKSEHTGVGNLIRKGWKLELRGGKKQKVESGV
jgi:hypothetical protein